MEEYGKKNVKRRVESHTSPSHFCHLRWDLNVYGDTPENGNGWYKKYVLGRTPQEGCQSKIFQAYLSSKNGLSLKCCGSADVETLPSCYHCIVTHTAATLQNHRWSLCIAFCPAHIPCFVSVSNTLSQLSNCKNYQKLQETSYRWRSFPYACIATTVH